ncbi:type I-E CRISPR-associated protein Cas5/CasD [Paraburkholderia sp. UCT31]|uniref:type I-E CRISPR-associated protein Cas5/CasD n=1 Tax=Paraburkholderia sp. UCT31 TaxID=2615209 RepID=UPI001655B6C3|nr:type I-E CRISPR-associated protein Cas5/CasD [Paraburkholderia sp. UCT31]MBC8737218.1 type I-E CRISPR-associated protein Cas5/CasD [Paraburkholderia sp. UCT31]
MFLIFQLKAPLSSFGSSVGEMRLSDKQPRKSAVTGLLAAALGIRREQTEAFQRLASSLHMAVCVLKEPLKLLDFHTVQSPVNREADSRAEQIAELEVKQRSKGGYSGTIVTRREYLQDGHWLVAVPGDASTLHDLAEALSFPAFTLYLGRKSCALSAYTAPLLIDTEFAEDALRQWAQRTGATLPREAALYWDGRVACKASPLAKIRKSDVRTRLTHNHFDLRDVFEGTALFEDVPCTSLN